MGFSKVWLKDAGKVHRAWTHEPVGNQSKNYRVAVIGWDMQTFGFFRVSME